MCSKLAPRTVCDDRRC